MGKPARGGQGLSNNGDAQGWTEEPQNRGSAEAIIPRAPQTGLPPWGCVCAPQFELVPKVMELLEEMQGFLQAFSLAPTREQGARGARPQPAPLGAGEICPSCSHFQKKTEAARRGGIIHTGKEERSLSAEPSRQEIGRATRQAEDEPGRPGVRADASTSRFLKAVRLISSRLPARTPAVCYTTRHYIFATYGVHHHPQAIAV